MPELSLEELASLDPSLDLFTASPPIDAELLRRGLVPPLPLCAGCLVWGFSLLRSARAAGLSRLSCQRVEGLERAELAALALRLEARPGAYRWSEKQALLALARSWSFSLNELSPLIEGRADPRLEEKIAQFSALPPALGRMVEQGELDLRAAHALRDLPESVVEAARGAPLTFSERREFLILLREVAGRERLSSGALDELARAALAAEPQPASASGQPKVQGCRLGPGEPLPLTVLRERRFPLLAGLRRRWAALEQELVAGSGVRLEPPPFFEGDAVKASFTFRSRQGLSRKLRALSRVEERCDELLGLLH